MTEAGPRRAVGEVSESPIEMARRASILIQEHSTTELPQAQFNPWPQTWKCKCGNEITALNFNSMQAAFIQHLVMEAFRLAAPERP
jgi:hypothetical protein